MHIPARAGFLLSLALVGIVVLDFLSLNAFRAEENKKEVDRKIGFYTQDEGSVLPGGSPTYYYKFYLKDSAFQNITNSESSDESYISGASVTVLNQSSFHCGDGGNHYTFEYYSGLYKLICQEAATMSLQIAASGYFTKTVSLAYYQGEIATIYLSKYVASTPPPPETIKDVSLPKVFKETGKSTNLTKIKDPAKVEGLILDTKFNTIKYKEVVNLSSTATKDKFKILDKYVKASQKGIVGLDSQSLGALNKQATVTMKSLTFSKTPKILVDGQEDKDKVVTDIKYEDGTLSFDVKHFSTFTVAPEITITEPQSRFETKNSQIDLKGTVSDRIASVSAKINGKNVAGLKVSTSSGEFSAKLDLIEGVNKIIVSALSDNGATSSASVSGSLILVSNSLTSPLSLLLAVLALVALGLVIWSGKMWMKKRKTETTKPSSTQG